MDQFLFFLDFKVATRENGSEQRQIQNEGKETKLFSYFWLVHGPK
jgi:hypothetical protein